MATAIGAEVTLCELVTAGYALDSVGHRGGVEHHPKGVCLDTEATTRKAGSHIVGKAGADGEYLCAMVDLPLVGGDIKLSTEFHNYSNTFRLIQR